MKLYSKLSALGAVAVLSTAFASATTIDIESGHTTTFYASTTATGVVGTPGTFAVNLSGVTPTWTAAIGTSSWVGISANAGPSSTINPAKGNYTFTDDLGSGLVGYTGSIGVLADDTTSVLLNGVQLVPQAGGGDSDCETGQPNCKLVFNVGLPGGAAFSSGDNVLTFVVLQAGTGPLHGGGTGDPSGLDYSGSISNTPAVPEPGTLLLLGTGLIGSAGALLRRMRSAVK